jgi:hypothetical protein
MNDENNNEYENKIIESIAKGVFQVSDIDKIAIARILELKQNFILSLNTYDLQTAKSQLTDLTSGMQQILEKYLEGKTAEQTTILINDKPFNFYDIQNSIPMINDLNTLRFITQKLSFIFDKFAKDYLKVSFAIQKPDLKKKF